MKKGKKKGGCQKSFVLDPPSLGLLLGQLSMGSDSQNNPEGDFLHRKPRRFFCAVIRAAPLTAVLIPTESTPRRHLRETSPRLIAH